MGWVRNAIATAGGDSPSARSRRYSKRDNRALKSHESSGVHDRGGLASQSDIENAGMDACGPRGLFTCVANGHVVFENSDEHLNITGGPGTGKTSCFGFPIAAEWQGSSVTVDVDGQYLRAVAPYKRSLGHKVIAINANRIYSSHSECWNILQPVINAVRAGNIQLAIELARDLAHILLPETPQSKGSNNEWIDIAAREILAAAITFLAKERPDECTLGGLFVFLMRPVQDVLDKMGLLSSELFVIRRATKLVSELNAGAVKQVEWKFEKSTEPLMLFEPGSPYDEVTRYSSFDAKLAKCGKRPVDIIITIDGTKLESAGGFISLMLSSLIEEIAGASGDRHTLILADEFSQCPKSRTLIKAMRAYRKRLIRVVTMSQSRQATADRYGETLQKDIEAMAGTNVWIAPEYAVSKELSEKSGTVTKLSRGMQDNQSIASPAGKQVSEISAPNLHLSELCFSKGKRKTVIVDSRALPGLLVTETVRWDEIHPYAEQLNASYVDDSNRHTATDGFEITSKHDAMALFGLSDATVSRAELEARADILTQTFPAHVVEHALAILTEQS